MINKTDVMAAYRKDLQLAETRGWRRGYRAAVVTTLALWLMAVAVLALAGCSSPQAPAVKNVAEQTAQPNRCHLEAKALMSAALDKDGDFSSLPKLPDRSMGIAACKGLSSEQLDAIALALQEELRPQMLAAAARKETSKS